MHKFTLFTILLSVITVSIVIDIVVNGYSLSNDYVPEKNQAVEEILEKTIAPAEKTDPIEASTAATKGEETNDEVALYSLADANLVDEVLLQEIGIERGIVKEVSNDQLYLQAIELPENVKNRLKIANLFDFEKYLGTMYGLRFQNLEQTEQFYSYLKAKALAVTGASIRETNTFGDASFYFNQASKTKTAFVAVRIGSNIYGFEYPHSSHQAFKDLSAALVTN